MRPGTISAPSGLYRTDRGTPPRVSQVRELQLPRVGRSSPRSRSANTEAERAAEPDLPDKNTLTQIELMRQLSEIPNVASRSPSRTRWHLQVVQLPTRRATAERRVNLTDGPARSRRREIPPMGLVTIALVIIGAWIGVLVFVLAIFKASGRADAEEERYLVEGRDDVSNQSRAPDSNDIFGDHRAPVARGELIREAQRLRIGLPGRSRVRLTRLAGILRHR